MLFYILSLSRLGSIRRGLASYSISYHALAVSAEAWHAILYLIMPWQHPPRLGVLITPWQYPPRIGMLFYILSRLGSISRGLASLSRLGSISRGLACYSISYHALAASAEAWHPYHALAVSTEAWQAILYLIMPWQHPPRLGMLFYILEAQVEQTETCRRAGSERYLVNMLRRF